LLRFRMPAPVLVIPPEPLPRLPETRVLPTLLKVRVPVLLVRLLVRTSVAPVLVERIVGVAPAVNTIGLFRVSVTPAVAVPAKRAVPVRVMVLGFMRVVPPRLRFKVVPVPKAIVPPVRLPNPAASLTLRVPVLSVVPPV
jgi:hypothetical protein